MAQLEYRIPWRLVAFALLFCSTIALGRYLTLASHSGPPTFWPASGLYFAFLFVSPRREWPALFGIALFSWLLGHTLSSVPFNLLLVPIWIIKSLTFALGVLLFQWLDRLAGKHSHLKILAFVAVGGLITPLLGALLTVPMTSFIHNQDPLMTIRYQFVSNSLGILVVAPLFISIFERIRTKPPNLNPKSLALDISLLLLILLATLNAFVLEFLPAEFRFSFMLFPFCMIVSMRGKPALTALSNACVSTGAIYQTIQGTHGLGLLVGQGLDGLTVIQLFVGTITLTQLLLTGIVCERKEAMANLDKRKDELESVNVQLEHAKEEASLASEAKSRFLAHMSHEIRSPLSAMIGFSDLIISGHHVRDEALHYVEIIRRNGRHLGQLIDQVLDLSKVEAGRFEVESKPVVIRELIEGTAHLMAVKAKEKGLSLDVEISLDMPRTAMTDALRLRQILINALGNAIKFTHRGSIRLYARPSKMGNNHWTLLCDIEDSGIGLTPEEQGRLFQAFSQADPSIARSYGGTGLGLTLSRHLARILGGDFTLVSSEKDHGSIFRLEIDCGATVDAVNSQLEGRGHGSAFSRAADALRGLKILLADDAPDNRLLISSLLKFSGANVLSVSNGREAVDAALREAFDLILMDVEMPELDGIQAVQQLRTLAYEGPIVALTGRAMRTEIEECLAAGFDSHLIKPIEREPLIEAVLQYARKERLYTPIPFGVLAEKQFEFGGHS